MTTHNLRDLVRKALVALLGATLILLGLAGSVLPVVPGFLLIGAGLIALAREFHWADRLVKRARSRLAELRPRPDRSTEAESPSAPDANAA